MDIDICQAWQNPLGWKQLLPSLIFFTSFLFWQLLLPGVGFKVIFFYFMLGPAFSCCWQIVLLLWIIWSLGICSESALCRDTHGGRRIEQRGGAETHSRLVERLRSSIARNIWSRGPSRSQGWWPVAGSLLRPCCDLLHLFEHLLCSSALPSLCKGCCLCIPVILHV